MPCYPVAFVIALLMFEDHILVGKADKSQEDCERFQDSCYYFSDETATREEAVQECKPGHLADITSEVEQVFIVDKLNNNNVIDAWFGLVKSLSWSDGSSLVHESWQNILAEDSERCFQLQQIFDYILNDIGCDEQLKSICEYELSGSDECGPGFTQFQRSCYQINDDTLNRTDAAAACNTSQAHLVDITSEEEEQYVVWFLTASGGGVAWLGLTLSDPPSWSDGSLLSPGHWYDITTNGQSVCYRLKRKSSKEYQWNDATDSSCRDKYRYVCEYEDSSTNEMQELTVPSTNSLERLTTRDRVFSPTSTTKTTLAISDIPNSNSPLETSTPDAILFTETSSFSSTSTSKSTVVLGMQQGKMRGAIVGSLFGVALLLVAIAAVIWFVLRQRKRNNPDMQSPGKVPSVDVGTTREPEHNNPTYAIDAEATTEDEAHQYNTVHDQTGEYTYIESNASGKGDEHIYAETAADRKSSHTSNKDSPDEGWKDNTIYVTSDDTSSAQNAEEGWADNSVYGK